jgi:hypothetical protein
MNKTALVLILFGMTNILFPDFIAYIIGGVSLTAGIIMLLGGGV